MVMSTIYSLILLVLGSGFFMSFLSIHFKMLNIGEFEIGLAQSAFYLGMLVSSLRSEKLIARVGHIRALTATSGLLSASTLGLFVIPVEMWVWLRLIAGACVGCFYVGIESWLLAEYPEHKRGVALAIYTIALYSSQAISQSLLTIINDESAMAITVSAIFISLAVVPVSMGKANGPVTNVADPESIFKFFKLSPLGVSGCLLAGMILSTLYSFMPLYFEARNFEAGYLMTTMVFGGAILQYPIGKISDHFERRKVLILLGLLGASSAILLLMIQSVALFYLGIFIAGGLLFTIYPVSMALGCDCVAPKDIVKMTGVLLFAYGVGPVIGPLVTPLMKPVHDAYPIYMLCLYSVLLIVVGTYALKFRKTVEPVDQSDFSMIPTGPIVEDLHPNLVNISEDQSSGS